MVVVFQSVVLLTMDTLLRSHKQWFSMSQKQRFYHNNNNPTPPEGGWAPAYANLSSSYFKYLVEALRDGCILPTDESAEVYRKNPYLRPINPYKFTCFFERAMTLMSMSSDNESFSFCLCLLWPHRPIHPHRALYLIPSLATIVHSP